MTLAGVLMLMLSKPLINQVHAIIQRDLVEVDDVFEVPAYDAAAMLCAGEGDVEGIGGPSWRDHACLEVGIAQAHGFNGDAHKFGPQEVFSIDLPDTLRCLLEFIDDDRGDNQLKASGFDLSEKLLA